MSKIISIVIFFCLLTSCVGVSKKEMIELDERNRDISVDVYKPMFSKSLIFNVESDGDFSNEDVIRYLYGSAKILNNKSFEKVYLAKKGEKRYYLEGDYFKQLGACQKDSDQITDMISRLIEHAYTMDGLHAFPCAKAGWILVKSQRMEYFDDLISELRED